LTVTILRNRFARGWPEHIEGERTFVLSLGDALERQYTTDAHFAAYHSPNGRRLTKDAPLQLGLVEMTAIVFDVDCEATHGSGEPAPEAWRVELREKVCVLASVHPDPYFYETKGGARIVYSLPAPFILSVDADAQRWAQAYALLVAHMERRFSIAADPACADWTRLFRLPHATRDGKVRPENRPIWGNPDRIGALSVGASSRDLESAKQRSRAFRERRLQFNGAGGDGLLFALLKARGHVGRQHRDGWICKCPRDVEHSTGHMGDGSTLVFPPAAGKTLGSIYCLHAGCSGITGKDWLQFFSKSEIEAVEGSRAA
jgi:hypothetical protein